ncbi:hypothetical protein DY000_02014923 [Brassica cretica]|uniref:Uncharacterized protein n=1 Tax=Brassica cretica TaxID=69181 RepID=A0ABQ7CTY7_BRACR|nr:hypothetical protein DY000_02014923 [Brassica cretica]
MWSPTEFERAPDGGAGEVTVNEAYLEAGFRGAIPSLIGEVSSFFGFSPSQLTPLTWRTLMAVGTEIRTVDFRLNKETRKTLISQRSRISANTTRQEIRTQE